MLRKKGKEEEEDYESSREDRGGKQRLGQVNGWRRGERRWKGSGLLKGTASSGMAREGRVGWQA